MSNSRHVNIPKTQTDISKALRLTVWAVPAMMALIGTGYTLFEHRLHVNDPNWPWPTLLGVVVLGILGPALSWVCLRWAIEITNAYLASQGKLAKRADELATLNKLSLAVSRSLNLDKTIDAILEHTIESLDANAGMVFIQEDGKSDLSLKAHRGVSLDMAQKEARLVPGHCLCGQAVKNRQVLSAYNIGEDPRCTSDLCICEGFRSVACAPLEAKGQLVGLLQLASSKTGHFSVDQKEFLAAAAVQVSASIENARLYDTVRAFNVELEQKVNRRTRELESARWALAEKARQLQRLLNQSYRIQDDTKARIAHDMHDGVTQIIIGALYETEAARQAILDDPDRASESLIHAQRLLTEVETEIRRVIYDLHPPVLDMMGLAVALKRYAATYTDMFNIECQITTTDHPRRLSKEIEIAVYRVIQAALQNVAAHAQATRVQVFFHFDARWLRVIVEDNGIGFDPEAIMNTPGDHLGLIGMKERAEGIGANLKVDSLPGEGTRIELHLPFPVYLEPDDLSEPLPQSKELVEGQ